MSKLLTITSLIYFSVALNVFAFGPRNNPNLMNLTPSEPYSTKAIDLPQSGEISHDWWSGDYWATCKRDIAHLWQGNLSVDQEQNATSETAQEFKRRLEILGKINQGELEYLLKLTSKDISRLTQENLDKLPPSLKKDIIAEDERRSLTRSVLNSSQSAFTTYTKAKKAYDKAEQLGDNAGMKQAKDDMSKVDWFGICHGWAPATILEKAPSKCEIYVPSVQRMVTMFVADTQSLISKMYAEGRAETQGFCGRRCNTYYPEDT
ncbi:hypothetical protein OAB57_03885, partial [Bacteriovoracaceae bacterium]|nr:hypothetical protein [Bacteriovoracaceae bacterium]